MSKLKPLGIADGFGNITGYSSEKRINFKNFIHTIFSINSLKSFILSYLFIKYLKQCYLLSLVVIENKPYGELTIFSSFSFEFYKILTSENYLNFTRCFSAIVLFVIFSVFSDAYIAKTYIKQ